MKNQHIYPKPPVGVTRLADEETVSEEAFCRRLQAQREDRLKRALELPVQDSSEIKAWRLGQRLGQNILNNQPLFD